MPEGAPEPGASREAMLETKPGMGVTHVGPVEMLSTPSMIGMMEGVCLQLMQEHMPANLTSVGARVDVSHLAPHPVGEPIKVRGTYLRTDGRRLIFQVEAFSGDVKIGDGIHERAVVDPERFRQR